MQKQTGFFWHLHHELLLEWCFSYDERVRHIKLYKPIEEQELRLRLFRPVKEELPSDVLKAGKAFDESNVADFYRNQQILEQVINDNMPAILALHEQECPNCPWDGKTIFPKKDSKGN